MKILVYQRVEIDPEHLQVFGDKVCESDVPQVADQMIVIAETLDVLVRELFVAGFEVFNADR